jgi:histidinol-phosphatase
MDRPRNFAVGSNHYTRAVIGRISHEGMTAFTAEGDIVALAHILGDAADVVSTAMFESTFRTVDDAAGQRVKLSDRLVQHCLIGLISAWSPHDGYLVQEDGRGSDGHRRWIIDPIDGTTAYRMGRPEWATLIGVEENDQLVFGLASAPLLGLRWWAKRGEGAWVRRLASGTKPNALMVSPTSELSQANIGYWIGSAVPEDIRSHVGPLMDCYPGVTLKDVRPSWDSGHPNGALMVASGALDLFVLVGGGPWDHAAPAAIVEEAGGRFSDTAGARELDCRIAVFSNGLVHESALQVINR